MTLRLVFRLPLRQAEGFLRSILALMNLNLDTPDHTTLTRRSQRGEHRHPLGHDQRARHGWDVLLEDIRRRLKCQRCGRRL